MEALKKPGQPARPAPTAPVIELRTRWQLFPVDSRPTAKAMAALGGVSVATWNRNIGAVKPADITTAGCSLTAEHLAACTRLLNAAAPWLPQVAEEETMQID